MDFEDDYGGFEVEDYTEDIGADAAGQDLFDGGLSAVNPAAKSANSANGFEFGNLSSSNDNDGSVNIGGAHRALVPASGAAASLALSPSSRATGSALEGDYELPPVVVKNMMATFNTDCDLDPRLVTIGARNAEFNPRRQNACIVRFQQPVRATAVLQPSGYVSITGVVDREHAKVVAKLVVRMCQKTGHPDAKIKRFKIASLVCTAACGFPVRLENLCADHSLDCQYEPEIFCGLTYEHKGPPAAKVLIFVSGKMLITGCTSARQADEVYKNVYALLWQYRG